MKYDVAIIGAGVGGMCAAGLLAAEGYKVVVAEKMPYLGGRASTLEHKGYKLGTGVIYLPVVGTLPNVFKKIGAEFNVRPCPRDQIYYRIDGTAFQMPASGGLRALLSKATDNKDELERVMKAVRRGLSWEQPSGTMSLYDWVLQYSQNEKVMGVFRGVTTIVGGLTPHEWTAGSFFQFVKESGGYRDYGHPPEGMVSLWESLARAIRATGGEVWTRTRVKRITVADGAAKGMVVEKAGKEVEIQASAVISDINPRWTVELAGSQHFDKAYLRLLRDTPQGSPGIMIAFSSKKPLMDFLGPYGITDARRVAVVCAPSQLCPEIAPPGRYLYEAQGSPISGATPYRVKEEIELSLQDLKDIFPDFNKECEVLAVRTYQREWSINTAWLGYELPIKTPVTNLYTVGDSVGAPGFLGSMKAAESGRIAAEELVGRLKPGKA